VWIINSIVVASDSTVYVGTSPNADIIKYTDGEAEKIYPVEADEPTEESTDESVNDDDDDEGDDDAEDDDDGDEDEDEEVADPNADETYDFSNEHVFAMALDAGGRLLAGISGQDFRLVRFDDDGVKTIFEPADAKYILAITLDELGNIYLGTGPEGRIYRLSPFGQNPRQIYDSRDKNILSLAVDTSGYVYAGGDERGLIYKIDQTDKTAVVLFDSEQSEITALLIDDEGNLYASATSAKAVGGSRDFSSISAAVGGGRPDGGSKQTSENKAGGSPISLKIANTAAANGGDKSSGDSPAKRAAMPKSAGHIYKISPEGFVTDIFSEMAVFFAMAEQDDQLLLGTGNKARLYAVDPETENKAVAYDDEQSSQITAVAVAGDIAWLGCANPPKLIKLSRSFAPKGSYISDLIDAGQPAKWGKLQIDADIGTGSKVLLASRSGNVKDPNDPTFSAWTKAVEVTRATQLTCPLGRYCQYKLTLRADTGPLGASSPVIREIAVAHIVPNLQPKVTSVKAARQTSQQKPGLFQVSFAATDDNKDKLIYEIEFRKIGRANWIGLKDKLAVTKYEWESKTVEDGRYEIRVTASDERSNTTATKLAGSRISDPVVVDNTPPAIVDPRVKIRNSKATLKFKLTDEFSAIGSVSYTVDSNTDWISTLPEDMIYDTTDEAFVIVIDDMEDGSHVLAVKFSDAVANTAYKTFDIEIK
ncbi:MAG: hypothetical protein KAR47_15380, partial [Planctomycetes bacterium]|nr:hypothetical protein [Planctomycetota bacterium]